MPRGSGGLLEGLRVRALDRGGCCRSIGGGGRAKRGAQARVGAKEGGEVAQHSLEVGVSQDSLCSGGAGGIVKLKEAKATVLLGVHGVLALHHFDLFQACGAAEGEVVGGEAVGPGPATRWRTEAGREI